MPSATGGAAPAALGCRTHTLGRQFDILGGALAKRAPQFLTGAGVVVPTIASTDAPTSGCLVIYSSDGVFLVAGMGDALSTWFEARSCERNRSPNECGGLGTATGFAIARLCYETLLSHGVTARRANGRHLVTPALERIVEANT